MDDEEMVTITKREYESLRRDSRQLMELDIQGVDNWDGYDYVNWSFVETGVRE